MASEGVPATLGAIKVGRTVGSVERGASGTGGGGCGKGRKGFGGMRGRGSGRWTLRRGGGDCVVGIARTGAGWKFDHWRGTREVQVRVWKRGKGGGGMEEEREGERVIGKKGVLGMKVLGSMEREVLCEE